MADSLTIDPAPHAEHEIVKPERRSGFVALFKAAMESLTAAQRHRFDNVEPLLYRFPPL